MPSLVEKCDELKSLYGRPGEITASELSRKFREIFPSSGDFARSELPIAEHVSETPWFWNTAVKLACDYPQAWLSDVGKAILVHADSEGLAEIEGVSELKNFRWPNAIIGIVRMARLRQRGEYEKLAATLKLFSGKWPNSVFEDEYLNALENFQSSDLVRWI
jgi:hypothetical protein